MARVDLVGNLNMDLIIRGLSRLPAWGREEIGSGCALVPSGQAGYTAFALRALGIQARLLSVLGDDDWGETLRGSLRAAGVDCSAVTTEPGWKTGISVACVREDGERAFVSDYGCLMDFDGELLRRNLWPGGPSPVLALCGLNTLPNLSPLDAAELFREARGAGAATILDTGWDPFGWRPDRLEGIRRLLGETSVFIPNLEEATAITGEEDPERAALALLDCGAELVVVKLGPEGSLALGERARERVPALPAEVLDAVGAGDAYNAGFIAGMLEGRPARECMILGGAVASIYISRAADRFPSREEAELKAARGPAARGSSLPAPATAAPESQAGPVPRSTTRGGSAR